MKNFTTKHNTINRGRYSNDDKEWEAYRSNSLFTKRNVIWSKCYPLCYQNWIRLQYDTTKINKYYQISTSSQGCAATHQDKVEAANLGALGENGILVLESLSPAFRFRYGIHVIVFASVYIMQSNKTMEVTW